MPSGAIFALPPGGGALAQRVGARAGAAGKWPRRGAIAASVDTTGEKKGISPINPVFSVFYDVESWIPVRVSRRSSPAKSCCRWDGRVGRRSARPPTPPWAADVAPANRPTPGRLPSLRSAANAMNSTIVSPQRAPPARPQGVPTVDQVKHHPARRNPSRSWHRLNLSSLPSLVNLNWTYPLFSILPFSPFFSLR